MATTNINYAITNLGQHTVLGICIINGKYDSHAIKTKNVYHNDTLGYYFVSRSTRIEIELTRLSDGGFIYETNKREFQLEQPMTGYDTPELGDLIRQAIGADK